MDENDKKILLELARDAIQTKLENKELEARNIPPELSEIKSCFVTLTKNEDLRGCMGHLEGFEPLYKNVIKNAVSAAIHDPRFPQVTNDEIKDIKIEISVLTKPEKLYYLNTEDLLKKLSYDKGVILKKGSHQSTFLPQVWEMFEEKEEFLKNLSVKAGLHQDAWKEKPEIYVYEVIKFSE